MYRLASPEIFKEFMEKEYTEDLHNVKKDLEDKTKDMESKKNDVNGSSSLHKDYLKIVNDLIAERQNGTAREPFKLTQLKYTKHHWFSGAIGNGDAIKTEIEIKPDAENKYWLNNTIHTYYMVEDYHKKESIKKESKMEILDFHIRQLKDYDIRNLKNNYFSDNKIERFAYWELEYNNHFKIVGTFDKMPDEIKLISLLFGFEDIIQDALDTVKKKMEHLYANRNKIVNLRDEIYNSIVKLPNYEEFTIQDFLKDYNVEEKEKFELCEMLISWCLVHDIFIDEKYPDSDLGLPWNIPRIKKDRKTKYNEKTNAEESKLSNDKSNATNEKSIKTKSMSDEKLKKFVVENTDDNHFLDEKVFEIVKKIIELPNNNETTIAKLINYNPQEEIIDPLTQGIVNVNVEKICEKLGIKLESTNDSLGGLAYNQSFKKYDKSLQENIPNNDKKKYTYSRKEFEEMFEKDENGAFIRLIIPANPKVEEYKEELNLIGKLPKDFSLDEIVRMKSYAGYITNHILDPNDINNTINVIVDVIEHLPSKTEISISQILGSNKNNYDNKKLFEINERVIDKCKEIGIHLNFDKYKDKEVGLPFNIPFIKE